MCSETMGVGKGFVCLSDSIVAKRDLKNYVLLNLFSPQIGRVVTDHSAARSPLVNARDVIAILTLFKSCGCWVL